LNVPVDEATAASEVKSTLSAPELAFKVMLPLLNGVSNAQNTVSTGITADGGSGIDTISANLITKNWY
jgi:hypothetical protein